MSTVEEKNDQYSTLTAVAIDDEPLALEVIRQLAQKVPFLKLEACFTNALQALDWIRRQPPDVLFLDIKMPDISGLELVKGMKNPPLIVFTTAYSDHAVQSFELDALDYLLKPFSLSRFVKSCNKAMDVIQLKRGNYQPFIFVKSGYEQIKINLAELDYVQSAGNYVYFHLRGKLNKKIIARMTLTEVEDILPKGRFIRIHRSYIVQTASILKVEKQTVVLESTLLPIGPGFVEDLHQTTAISTIKNLP